MVLVPPEKSPQYHTQDGKWGLYIRTFRPDLHHAEAFRGIAKGRKNFHADGKNGLIGRRFWQEQPADAVDFVCKYLAVLWTACNSFYIGSFSVILDRELEAPCVDSLFAVGFL